MTKFEASGIACLEGRGKVVCKSPLGEDLYLVEFLGGQRLYAFLPRQPNYTLLKQGTEVIVAARVQITAYSPPPHEAHDETADKEADEALPLPTKRHPKDPEL